MATLIALMVHAQPQPDQRLAAALTTLEQRRSAIASVDCSYERTLTATPRFVAAYAKDRGSREDKVRVQFNQDSRCRFVEMADGRFYLEMQRQRLDGSKHKLILSKDDRETWRLGNDFRGSDWQAWQVVIGGNIADEFEAGALARRYLDLQVRKVATGLVDAIKAATGVETLGDEKLHQDDCLVVRWAAGSPKSATRTTAWLDKQRGYIARRLLIERKDAKSTGWSTREVRDVESAGMADFKDDAGKRSSYWYPTNLVVKIYNESYQTFEERFSIFALQLNTAIPQSLFTPTLENGSNVIDERRNKTYVYGRGPSDRLRHVIDRRIDETKAMIRSAGAQGPSEVQAAEGPGGGYLPAIAVVLGVAGLIAALAIRLRSRAKN